MYCLLLSLVGAIHTAIESSHLSECGETLRHVKFHSLWSKNVVDSHSVQWKLHNSCSMPMIAPQVLIKIKQIQLAHCLLEKYNFICYKIPFQERSFKNWRPPIKYRNIKLLVHSVFHAFHWQKRNVIKA